MRGWRLWVLVGLVALGCEAAQPVTLTQVGGELALLESQEQVEFLRKKCVVDRVGDAAKLEGTEPVLASWFSLVVGLEGTGTREVPALEIEPDVSLSSELLKRLYVSGFSGSATQILRSADSAPVRVSATIPPLVRANERLDVQLQAMAGAKSLRGGVLVTTPVRQHLASPASGSNYGDVWAYAEGKVTLSPGRLAFGESAPVNETVGYVPAGATSEVNGFLGLRLRQPDAYAAGLIALMLNERFPGCAVALGPRDIRVSVPEYYRREWQRFTGVLLEVRCRPPRGRQLRAYISSLSQQLQGEDPVLAQQAAFKLEALGPEAVPTLEGALQSPRPAVRRLVVSTLAAMREPAGIAALEQLLETDTEEDRRLAARYLTFYSQQNVRDYQKNLLADPDPEVRYHALLGLEQTQEDAPYVTSETAKDEDFRISRVRSAGPPALVVKAQNPRRLVFFGEVQLRPPFKQVQLGELAVEARDSSRVTIDYRVYGQPNKLPIHSLDLVDLVRALDHINVTINDIMDLIFKLSRADAISGEVLFVNE